MIILTKKHWPYLWLELSVAARCLYNSWICLHSDQAMPITADKVFVHIQLTQLDPPPPWGLTLMGSLCRVGVRYLLDIWGGCWSDHQTDIENGEVGLSQAILADGYNIASMQHEYQGLDFRQQPDRLQCKGRLGGANPTFCCDTPGRRTFPSHAQRIALPLCRACSGI